jgi:hypothetical protein
MDVVRLLLKTRLRAGQECDREAFFSVLVCIRHTSFPTAAHQVLVNSKICSKVDFVGRKKRAAVLPHHIDLVQLGNDSGQGTCKS